MITAAIQHFIDVVDLLIAGRNDRLLFAKVACCGLV